MEYLLEKYKHTCAYCGVKHSNEKHIKFEKDHVVPRSQGGTNRISSLVLACYSCNQAKGAMSVTDFLANKPKVLKRVKSQLKAPLRDAAAVNSSRNAIYKALLAFNISVETSSGAITKYNRGLFNIPKTHSLDAACIGDIAGIKHKNTVLGMQPDIPSYIGIISCQGRGRYQRAVSDKNGFPILYKGKSKFALGFQTGDLATVYTKTEYGVIGRLAKITIRTNGYFKYTIGNNIKSTTHKNCKKLQNADGYKYDYEVRGTLIFPGGKAEIQKLPKMPSKLHRRTKVFMQ